jgi:type III secretory pathway component EscV
MSFCSSCGANIEGAGNFCSRCGANTGARPAGRAEQTEPGFLYGVGRVVGEILTGLRVGKSVPLLLFAALAVIVVTITSVNEEHKKIRMEKGIAESAKIAEQGERERKAAQEAQAAQEQKDYEALPIEAKNRIAFGKLIQTTFQTEGRRMAVRATGENFDTLELSSGLIFEGSYTLDAAREAVDPDVMKMLKQLKFKRVLIKGSESGFAEGYLVQ